MLIDRPLAGRIIAFRMFETNSAVSKKRLFRKQRKIGVVDIIAFCAIAYLIASTF